MPCSFLYGRRKERLKMSKEQEIKMQGGGNPLGYAPVTKLMLKFAIPSIVAMLVGSLYNIVDQIFIGNTVGPLGNAATNVAFPLTTVCTSIALLFGIGGASSFNLAMGRDEKDKAAHYVGSAVTMLMGCGVLLTVITLLFLEPLLKAFGSPDDVLGYAKTYVSVTAIGFPFLILTTGGGHLIRADGNPRMTMVCNLSGAVINTGLDALFLLVFDMGMFGAALATIIGQIFSGLLALWFLFHYKTVKLQKKHYCPKWSAISKVASLGTASFFNQIAMMVVQIALNNSLTYYGRMSEYGDSVPLACAGVVSKVAMIYMAIVIGIAQGTQPVESFNYGARNYRRVKSAYRYALYAGGAISIAAFGIFQIFPRQIISLFGDGSELYFRFGISYFRIYFFFTFLNYLQPITSTFFTSIGKPYKGIFLSLTRQILFLLPLILLLPKFFGIDGIVYSGAIADLMAAIVAIVMVVWEFGQMRKLEKAGKSEIEL